MQDLDQFEWDPVILDAEGNRKLADLNNELLLKGEFDLSVMLVGIMLKHTAPVKR